MEGTGSEAISVQSSGRVLQQAAKPANNSSPSPERDESSSNSPSENQPVSSSTMAASTQKRWLTNPKSKIANADLLPILRQEQAWNTLPRETRQQLYGLLPAPREGEAAHDIDVHPLKSPYKQYIEEGIRTWQADLKDGREVKTWRDQAMQVEKDREEGMWDEFLLTQRDEDCWPSESDDRDEDSKAQGSDVSEGSEIVVKPNPKKTKLIAVAQKKTEAEAIKGETDGEEAED